MSLLSSRPPMKIPDHPDHVMPEHDYDGEILNPDMPNTGEFSRNTERFTRDKNEKPPSYRNERDL